MYNRFQEAIKTAIQLFEKFAHLNFLRNLFSNQYILLYKICIAHFEMF